MKLMFWISTFMVLYTYAVYPITLLFIRKNRKEAQAASDCENFPMVSVLVCAHNEEKIIREKIGNLLALDYPKQKIEILIASDGSFDATDAIISEYREKGVKLVRMGTRCGKVNALNKTIPQAEGEIIVLSDANTIYKSDAVREIVRPFSNPVIGCVCGELIFQNDAGNEVSNLEGVYWRYEQFMKVIEGANGALLGANGGIYAIRKKLFEPLPANTIVDDFVLPMKILEKRYKVVYEASAIAYEETSKKIIQEMERRIRIGAGDFQALLFTWRILNPLRGFPAFAYLSHKVIRWFAPFFMIFAFVSNMALLENGFYGTMFIIQCVFYGLAIASRMLAKIGVNIKLLGLPYYFVSMNIALFLGFIRFCTNSQSVMWTRTER